MAKIITILPKLPQRYPVELRYMHREPNKPLLDNVDTIIFYGNFDPIEDVAAGVETPDHVRKASLVYHHLTQYHRLTKRILVFEDTLRSKNITDDNTRDSIQKEIEVLNAMRQPHLDYFIQNDHLAALLNGPLSMDPRLRIPSEIASPDFATLPTKRQYGILFNKYLSLPKSHRDEAKQILVDNNKWVNSSKYLRDARKEAGLSLDELRSRPCFDWIDPKGTAKD